MTKDKKFFILNICLFICDMICLVCYNHIGGVWLKGVTSSWFVMLGVVNLIYAQKKKLEKYSFLIFMELALTSGMIADVLLGIWFITGVLVFALGHVFYLLAFYRIEKFSSDDIKKIIPIAIVSLFIVIGTPYVQVEDGFIKILLLGYAVVISCMLGKTVSNFYKDKSISRILLLVGGILFWFSDVMLAGTLFGNGGKVMVLLCSYTYWPAQNILALSMYYYVKEKMMVKE